MINFCTEWRDDGEVIIHRQSCGHYDHGSLLGEGKIYHLGNFDSPALALKAARRSFPQATLCEACGTAGEAQIATQSDCLRKR